MSNYSGFSQALNISGISNVSRSTSIRGPGRVDLSAECSSQTNLTGRLAKGSSTGIKGGSSQLEEINKALSQCQEVISDYAIKKLMYQCLREVSRNEDRVLSESTARKIRQILTVYEVEKYLHLPNNSNHVNEELTLLGITDLPKVQVTKEDKLDVKRSLENKLRKKTDAYLSRYAELGGNLEDLMKRTESAGRQQISQVLDTDLFQWKEKIDQECLEYEKHLVDYRNNLSEWISLKYGDMNNIQLKKANRLLIKVRVSEAQAKITKLNCILRTFNDTPCTLKAYQILSSNLGNKIAIMEEEIQRKEAMKKSYNDLSGTEYDQVVQRYSDLCKAIDKKKCLIEKIYS